MKKMLGLLGLILMLLVACTPGGIPPDATGSIGSPDDGYLVDGIRLQPSDAVLVLEPEIAYGAKALVDLLEFSALQMQLAYPETVPLVVGHLSDEEGGPLRPHKSHQSGRDVDVAMYSANNKLVRGFATMNRKNLDVEKTWFYMETLLQTGMVQYIFLDWQLQKIIYEEIKIAYPQQDLDRYFQYPRPPGARKGIIRHAAGHGNHLHIRIHCPESDRYCIE